MKPPTTATLTGMAWVKKSSMTPKALARLQHNLTVRQKRLHPKSEPAVIPLYRETDTLLGIPRGFFCSKQKRSSVVDKTTKGGLVPKLDFEGALRPYQQPAFDSLYPKLVEGYGGILRAPTGFGKTVFALYVAAQLGVPCLICVHMDTLKEQWLEAIRTFLPEAKVGILQGKKLQFKGCHFVIAMMQTLSRRVEAGTLPDELRESIGFLIFDEVHRLSAPTFAKIPPVFPARWRLGVSATPHRKDGTDDVFYYHLGDLLYYADQALMTPTVLKVETGFSLPYRIYDTPNEATVLKILVKNRGRNLKILDLILRAVKKGRKILVLSRRLELLRTLDEMLKLAQPDISEYPELKSLYLKELDGDTQAGLDYRSLLYEYGLMPTTSFCVGGTKKEALEKAKKAQVLFATYKFAGEGFDVPALDTLIMVTPIGDCEQAVGRILRLHDGKQEPVVVDIRDDLVPLLSRWGIRRDKFYDRISAKVVE